MGSRVVRLLCYSFSMVAATTSPESDRPEPGEQRLIFGGVTYKDYVLLGDVFGHRPGLHLTYLRGTLEIMTTSPVHEHLKKLIARLVELHALVRGVRILGFGSAASQFFPDLDFAVLAEHVAMPDQDDAVRAYWVRLRG